MAIRWFLLTLLWGTGLFLTAQDYPVDYFASPLDIPLELSGSFGELRGNHFHSGVDFKTRQREGLPVRAAARGQVVRIKVSPYGFGKALYIAHPNGYTTVYAHLQRFSDTIEKYVKQAQYDRESFAVELFPPAGSFPVSQGQIIALSGNTGGSGGPHLHFEIRDSRTEEIINPLHFGFDVKDTRPPDLYQLEVYEFFGEEMVSSYTRKLLQVKNGQYSLSGQSLLEVNHLPAFGLVAYDRQDGSTNRNGVYRLELEVGDQKLYDFRMDRFSFAETRYINSHLDYSQKICCRKKINRLYLEPNNQLSVYQIRQKMNFPHLEPDSVYRVRITASDQAANVSLLEFDLVYRPDSLYLPPAGELPVSVFRYDQPNFFKNEHLELNMPEGALYRSIYFEYQRQEPCPDCLSFVHQVASASIPVHRNYSLRIRPNMSWPGATRQLGIATIEDGSIESFEGGEWHEGWIEARVREFGDFAVVADTVPPSVKPRQFRDGADLRGQSRISFTIEDPLSGVEDYRVQLNGRWVLFEYDAKNDLLFADIAAIRQQPGEQVLEIEVTDAVGNRTRKNYHLIF